MHEHAAIAANGLDHHDQAIAGLAVRHQSAAITDLATAFAIERRDIQHHLHGIPCDSGLRRLTIHHQGLNAAALFQLLITPEFGVLQACSHLIDRVLQREIDAHRSCFCPLTLLLHRRLKPGDIHGKAMLLSDLLGELQGKP